MDHWFGDAYKSTPCVTALALRIQSRFVNDPSCLGHQLFSFFFYWRPDPSCFTFCQFFISYSRIYSRNSRSEPMGTSGQGSQTRENLTGKSLWRLWRWQGDHVNVVPTNRSMGVKENPPELCQSPCWETMVTWFSSPQANVSRKSSGECPKSTQPLVPGARSYL